MKIRKETGADPGFCMADTNRPPNETLILNCPTADDLSARQCPSTNRTCIVTPDLRPIRENAESARLKKSVAVQKIFVETGRHFQRSRCVNQNSEKRPCVQCVQITEKQSKWRTVCKGVTKTQEFKGVKFRRQRYVPVD